MIYLIIYLCLFAICSLLGIISGIRTYIKPISYHNKFPWYYEIIVGVLVGLLSPLLIFILLISWIQELAEKKK